MKNVAMMDTLSSGGAVARIDLSAGRRRQQTAGELTAKQRRAIAALLTTRTVQQAAAESGVGERTLYRWLGDPDFRAAYAETSHLFLAETVGRLRATAGEAVETLRAALQDKLTSNRIRAAIALLDSAVKVDVDDLARRVEDLEANFAKYQ